MPDKPLSASEPRSQPRWLLVLAVLLILGGTVYAALGPGGLSIEALLRHRAAIDAFVAEHRLVAVLAYIALYIATVALSVPGAALLTVSGGFLFGLAIGAVAAVIGATVGATLVFLLARTALGEPLLRRAGPRALKLAQGFREDAFSYLLFLRLVPAFPFFLVNLVPAFAGVRLAPFVAATALGVIPGAFVYAFAGTGLDSVLAAQSAGHILTPELIGALVALALLALLPVLVKRWRARSRASE